MLTVKLTPAQLGLLKAMAGNGSLGSEAVVTSWRRRPEGKLYTVDLLPSTYPIIERKINNQVFQRMMDAGYITGYDELKTSKGVQGCRHHLTRVGREIVQEDRGW